MGRWWIGSAERTMRDRSMQQCRVSSIDVWPSSRYVPERYRSRHAIRRSLVRRASLRVRILVLLAGVALVSAGATAWVTYVGGRNAIEAASFDLLTSVRENKADQVEDFFRSTCDQVVTLSSDLMVTGAMGDFSAGYRSVEPPSDPAVQSTRDRQLTDYYTTEFMPRLEDATLLQDRSVREFIPTAQPAREIQHQYIVDNPFPTGEKSALTDTGEGTLYASAHDLYHPILRDFVERFGYYDLFLIDADSGNIVYSVFKEIDFGTSLLDGPHSDTNLADAYHRARDSDDPTFCGLEDFAPYAPSYDAPASFIASPIPGPNGTTAGVLAFQMPIDRINEIMTSAGRWEDVGLGESGETYLVGEDLTLRSESRFLLEDKGAYLAAIEAAGLPEETVNAIDVLGSAVGLQVVDTPGTTTAHQHRRGTDTFEDYRGVSVLSAFQPLEIAGVDWVIMSEIDEAEAFDAADEFARQALLTLIVAACLIVLIALWFSRRLVQPINRLAGSAAAIAAGDLDTAIDTGGSDEIGELARSFAEMQQAVTGMVRGQERQIEALSAPLIPLRDDVVVLPIVGELDPRRSVKISEGLVTGVFDRSARVAIIDLTGTRVTDDAEQDELALAIINRAFESVHLMGVQVILTGMQAELATRVTESSIDLEGVATESSLQSGIDRAVRISREAHTNETGG